MEKNDINIAYLKHLIAEGLKWRYGDVHTPEMDERIELELNTIIPNGFVEYILMLHDFCDFCRTPDAVLTFCEENGLKAPPDGIIPLGPGRGSVGGSFVCYLLGIHNCDPMLFNLYFERFLNPERISMPDIDTDISQRYRYIGIAYFTKKYGADKVAQIITYGTLSVKTAIHDVLQAANVPNSAIDALKKTVSDEPTTEFEDVVQDERFMQTLQSIYFPDATVTVNQNNARRILEYGNLKEHTADIIAIMNGAPAKEFTVKSSWTWEKALNIMRKLEGLNKNESLHAGGIVVAPVELATHVPLFKRKGEGNVACQYDMIAIEELGYLKLDLLGLRTVDVNYDSQQLIRKWYDPDFALEKIPLNDKETIKMINDGDTIGIFQIESTGFTQMMQQLDIGGYESPRYQDRDTSNMSWVERTRGDEIRDFMWISAGIALYRPGPLDAILDGKNMVQHLIDRKNGTEPTVYLFPEEKNYLEETYGILVYQEEVMARVRQMTGCSLGRADIMRKAMGKKDPVLMKEQTDWFVQEAMNHEFTSQKMDEKWKRQIVERAANEIKTFSRYGFNKAHTVEYGHIAYWNAYMKCHYPTAFYTALLNSESDRPDRQTIIINDMLKHDIQLLPPSINESEADFTMTDDRVIRFGLKAIKNVGDKAIDNIFTERKVRGQFKSVDDFRLRIDSKACTVVGMTNLAKCGAFDELIGAHLNRLRNRATLVESMKAICDKLKKYKAKKPKKPAPTVDEALYAYNFATHDGDVPPYEITECEDNPIQYSVWEKEILKYYISAHPIDAYEDEIRRWTAIQDGEIADMPNEMYIAGFIDGHHETVIKKEGRNQGKKMGFVTIGTAYRQYEAVMFPGVYESCLPYIKDNAPVVLKGKKNFYKDVYSIQAVYIRPMVNEGIRDCPECHIRLPQDFGSNPLRMMELNNVLKQHPGLTKVYLHASCGYYDFTIEVQQPISLTDHVIDYVESFAELSYKPN